MKNEGDAPRINGATVFGVRPGAPLVHTIPIAGQRPLTVSAAGLPVGVRLDPATGRLHGRAALPGRHEVRLQAKNRHGTCLRDLTLAVGADIALTPPLGWNSWNCWADSVDQDKILQAAEAMVHSGLSQHGWAYVNIDVGWQGSRGGPHGAIQGNNKFPDMEGLCRHVHSLGLKVGIYSTPWVRSYADYTGGSGGAPRSDITEEDLRSGRFHGRVRFEMNDARQWAQWGMDYLKYDWHPVDVPSVRRMHDALLGCGRDIVLSLSNRASLDQAHSWVELANCWRTTGDIRDAWTVDDGEYWGVTDIGFSQEPWLPFTGPGHWPDADMLVLGHLGWGPDLRPTSLTRQEQKTHVSLWSLLCAPLLLGCDLTRLDDFTLGLLTNDEVLAVNQDPLGRPAARVASQGQTRAMAREMADGSMAAGLFNLADQGEQTMTLPWEALGIQGPRQVRDLWQQEDLGTFEDRFEARVPAHGTVLVRL